MRLVRTRAQVCVSMCKWDTNESHKRCKAQNKILVLVLRHNGIMIYDNAMHAHDYCGFNSLPICHTIVILMTEFLFFFFFSIQDISLYLWLKTDRPGFSRHIRTFNGIIHNTYVYITCMSIRIVHMYIWGCPTGSFTRARTWPQRFANCRFRRTEISSVSAILILNGTNGLA